MDYENDDRPTQRFQLNNRNPKDMNETYGITQMTNYYDKNGNIVHVGDWIEFLFWHTCSDGLQREKYIYGRILKRKNKLVFRYKTKYETNKQRYSERRLECLNFDSTCDWEILKYQKGYGVFMPAMNH